MARQYGWMAAKLAFAGVLGGVALHVTGLATRAPVAGEAEARAQRPARVADTRPLPRPAPAAAPGPRQAVDDRFVVKRVLRIDGPFRHGDYAWDDKGVPEGPIVITVDLAAQTLSVFRDGYEIGAAVILYGADNMETPLGTFPITQKDADHVSNLYDAPMPYMLRLTNDGVSIHGTDEVVPNAATHGCIGVPVAFARLLFAQAKLGDPVVITNGRMMDLRGARVG